MRKLTALVRLVRELGVARDARQIYEPALAALHAIAGVERSSILLLDDAGTARFVAWRGISEQYRTAVEGHFPWALDDPAPRPVLVEDVERTTLSAPILAALAHEHIRAVGFIPLLYGERLVGKFMIYYDSPHVFEDEDVELANAVAYLVAFAIERARLHAALEESDRRKDAFLATLGHELRNPLAAASAAIEVASEQVVDIPAWRQARDVLARSVRNMVQLVDDLLDVSRITRGLIAIDKREIDLTSIVHHAIAPVQQLIASQRQELTVALADLWLVADPVRVEQVITNLVQNAAKYTLPGGHIRVSTSASNSGVEIRVEDDGIGIDPTEIPRLFELFEQADKSVGKTTGGLGIGLTIVRELVKLHGGAVRAASPGLDRGSTFTVWLPERVAPRPAAASSSARKAARRRRLLVVDDNPDISSTLATLLEARGHDVTVADDGPSAIAAVDRWSPEVVLLDLGLPGMTGFDVAARLRATGHTDLKIIAVSGYGQPADVAKARAAGCDMHLTKPIDLGALERGIE